MLTTVGAGAKFDKDTYKMSAGLHGIGAKAVTALSEWTEAEVRRNGKVYHQEYERGKAITASRKSAPSPDNRTGTKITFKPDPEIFHNATFDYDTLEVRLRELAFLNKGLAIRLTDERTGKEETFNSDGGIAEFVEYLNRTEETLHKVVLHGQDGRRRPRRGCLCSTPPARKSASAATPTTPTTRRRHPPVRLPRRA